MCANNSSENGYVLTEYEKCGVADKNISEVRFENCKQPLIPKNLFDLFQITSLNLSNLSIESLELECPDDTHLQYLAADGNQFTEISADFLKNCFKDTSKIDLSGNKIRTMTRFEGINANTSNIIVWSYRYFFGHYQSELLNLVHLNLSNNELTAIKPHFDSMPYLVELDVSYNRIENIDVDSFDNNQILAILDLSHNLIRQIHKNAFRKCMILEKLNLSYNNLHIIEPHTFFVQNLLKNLDLSYNNVTVLDGAIFADSMDQIKFISFEHNPVQTVHELAHSIYTVIVGVDFTQLQCLTTNSSVFDANHDDSVKINCTQSYFIPKPTLAPKPRSGFFGWLKNVL